MVKAQKVIKLFVRNKNKSKVLVLKFLTTKNQVIKKNNVLFSLELLKIYFLFYSGVDYISIRIRVPFNFFKVKSFVISKPRFDLIPLKFKKIKKVKKR